MATTVIHVRAMKPGDVYIGRRARGSRTGPLLTASVWANRFVIGVDGPRVEVIDLYRARLLDSPDLLAQLPELRGRRLACWCSPALCHGDVLAELADGLEGGC